MEEKNKENKIGWRIVPTKFSDMRNGEIVTEFNIFDIKYMKKIEED
jgi:hypothetical protein